MPRFIGYNFGRAGNINKTSEGPLHLMRSSFCPKHYLENPWTMILSEEEQAQSMQNNIEEVQRYNKRLARQTQKPGDFVVIGGDHSSAMGTWSGARARSQTSLGMIWIDAHTDAHTLETSETGNIHGMPLAALLGAGQKALMPWHASDMCIFKPEDVHIIGYRSFEAPELALLKKLGVNLYPAKRVIESTFSSVYTRIVAAFKTKGIPFGISLDLDSMDPLQVPAVTVPEAEGLCPMDVLEGLKLGTSIAKPVGLELVEFAPSLDQEQITERLVFKFLDAIYPTTD